MKQNDNLNDYYLEHSFPRLNRNKYLWEFETNLYIDWEKMIKTIQIKLVSRIYSCFRVWKSH